MAKMTYAEQLQHPNWQKRRLERLALAQWACEKCGNKDLMLHVHHKRYVRGHMAWEYEDDELTVLCATCHGFEHADRELLDQIIADLGPDGLTQIIGLLGGYLDATLQLDTNIVVKTRNNDLQRRTLFDLGVAAAALSYSGDNAAREIVRAFVKENSICPPSFRAAIRRWDASAVNGKS